MGRGLDYQKDAVASGYWPLFRYNPLLKEEGKNPLVLDSQAPKMSFEEYALKETRFKSLMTSNPERAKMLLAEAQKDVKYVVVGNTVVGYFYNPPTNKLETFKSDPIEGLTEGSAYKTVTDGSGQVFLMPETVDFAGHAWHLFVVRTSQRAQLQAHLQAHSVGTLIHYPIPPHMQEAYIDLHFAKDDFPIARELADQVLSLPIGPHLSDSDVTKVIEVINGFDA
jgi:hypothetical protein